MQKQLGGPPDVAIALNAGLGTPHYEWARALTALAKSQTPFVFTDYTEFSIEAGVMLIKSLESELKARMKVTIPSSLNPFRQPLRWPEAANACFTIPWLSNGFLCGVNTT